MEALFFILFLLLGVGYCYGLGRLSIKLINIDTKKWDVADRLLFWFITFLFGSASFLLIAILYGMSGCFYLLLAI